MTEGDYFSGRNGDFKLRSAHLSFQLRKCNKNGSYEEKKGLILDHIEESESQDRASFELEALLTSSTLLRKVEQGQSPESYRGGRLTLLHFFTYCCSNCLWCVIDDIISASLTDYDAAPFRDSTF